MVVLRKAHQEALAAAPTLRLPHAGDCLLLAYFFLLRPGEYSGIPHTAVDDLFRIQDVGVWLGHRRLDPLLCPATDLIAASFATLTFTTQGLVLSSVANLVHLCGEDVGSNPARTVFWSLN